jgi:lipopolysaccharide biosynthesis glycosyltransferase
MSKNVINVCLSTDRNYVQHAGVTIASILKHAEPEDQLCFYIIHKDLTDKEKGLFRSLNKLKKCDFHFVSPKKNLKMNLHNHPYISQAAFYRMQLPEVIPQVDRIIYVDCDVLALASLAELWTVDMNDCIIAGVADYKSDTKEHNQAIGCENFVYINSGVLLMDLAKARQEKLTEKLLKTAEELGNRATLHDQDIINVALQGEIFLLPLKWNLSTGYFKRKYDIQYYSEEEIKKTALHPAIAHISGGRKPWSWKRCRHFYWFEYFKALKGTPWSYKYYSGLIKKIILPYKRGTGPAS